VVNIDQPHWLSFSSSATTQPLDNICPHRPEVETISSSGDAERQGCLVAAGLSIKVLFSEHWVAGAKLTRLAGLRVEYKPLLLHLSHTPFFSPTSA
jgi:hypothetical protein